MNEILYVDGKNWKPKQKQNKSKEVSELQRWTSTVRYARTKTGFFVIGRKLPVRFDWAMDVVDDFQFVDGQDCFCLISIVSSLLFFSCSEEEKKTACSSLDWINFLFLSSFQSRWSETNLFRFALQRQKRVGERNTAVVEEKTAESF